MTGLLKSQSFICSNDQRLGKRSDQWSQHRESRFKLRFRDIEVVSRQSFSQKHHHHQPQRHRGVQLCSSDHGCSPQSLQLLPPFLNFPLPVPLNRSDRDHSSSLIRAIKLLLPKFWRNFLTSNGRFRSANGSSFTSNEICTTSTSSSPETRSLISFTLKVPSKARMKSPFNLRTRTHVLFDASSSW